MEILIGSKVFLLGFSDYRVVCGWEAQTANYMTETFSNWHLEWCSRRGY